MTDNTYIRLIKALQTRAKANDGNDPVFLRDAASDAGILIETAQKLVLVLIDEGLANSQNSNQVLLLTEKGLNLGLE